MVLLKQLERTVLRPETLCKLCLYKVLGMTDLGWGRVCNPAELLR